MKTRKKAFAGIILIFIAIAITCLLFVITSKSDVLKQQGGIPDSNQIYEYYSFSGQTNPLYNKLLSLKYDYDNSQEITNESYMVLCIDNELNVLPDRYLYSNYSDFNVHCEVVENNYRFLKIKYTGEGASNSVENQNIDFILTIDWYEVFLHNSECAYISF